MVTAGVFITLVTVFGFGFGTGQSVEKVHVPQDQQMQIDWE